VVTSEKQLAIRNDSADVLVAGVGVLSSMIELPKSIPPSDEFNNVVKAINSFIKLPHPKTKEEP
jgi:hypothetical protein